MRRRQKAVREDHGTGNTGARPADGASAVKRIMLLLAVMLFSAEGAWAQTALSVSLATGTLAWDAPPDGAPYLPLTQYVITCGTASTNIPAPATSVPVRTFVPSPGVYDCTIRAENAFGRSAEAPIPSFTAGYPPAEPAAIRLEVR